MLEIHTPPPLMFRMDGKDYSLHFSLSEVVRLEERLGRPMKAVTDWLHLRASELEATLQTGLERAHTENAAEVASTVCAALEVESVEAVNQGAGLSSDAAKQAVASRLAIAEMKIAGDRATAAAQMEIQRASVDERLQSELSFAQREYDVKEAANKQQMAALNRTSNDYANQLKALQEKALEITQQHETAVAELRARAAVEQNKKDLADLEAGERSKIEATAEGSQARLDAVDAALKTAQQNALQDTDFYRSLQQQKVEVARQFADQQAKLQAEAGREAADNALKMGQLELAAQMEAQQLQDSRRRVTDAQRVAEETDAVNRAFAIKLAANIQDQAALNASGNDYLNKLKALQNKESQLIREHENEKAAIKDKAIIAQNAKEASSYQQLVNTAAHGLTSVLMAHQSFGSMMTSIGDQVIAGMMENAIKSVGLLDFDQERQAAHAARDMYLAGMKLPFPANIVAAPVMAAGAFATMMAFEGGGVVPGNGRGDVVPAMLTPGEGIVPGSMMDRLNTAARNGGFQSGPSYTVHVRPTYHLQALDSSGLKTVLQKHSDTLTKHFENAVRKLNY